MVLAAETGLVTIECEEGVAGLGLFFVGERGADVLRDEFEFLVEIRSLANQFEIELGAFDAPETALAPLCTHDLGDEINLHRSARLELTEICGV
jgi:hypothetical protein